MKPQLIQILGVMPRSGTNFLFKLLSLHPHIVPNLAIREDFLLSETQLLQKYFARLDKTWGERWRCKEKMMPKLKERVGQALVDFVVEDLYAAFRRSDPTEVDEFYPAGVYGLVFSVGEGGLTGITVRLDNNGQIIRLDYFIQPPETEIDREGIELLIPPVSE